MAKNGEPEEPVVVTPAAARLLIEYIFDGGLDAEVADDEG